MSKDLDFWMDSSSNSDDVSDDGDMIIPSPRTPTKTSAPSHRGTPKATKVPTEEFEPVAQLKLNPVPTKINPLNVDDSESDIDDLPPYADPRLGIEYLKRQLVNELSVLEKYANDDDDVRMTVRAKSFVDEEPRREGDVILVFETPDGNSFEKILRKGNQLVDLMKTFPEDLQDCRVSMDGVVTEPENVINDLLQDYMKLKLVKPVVQSTEGFMRLSFAFPDGTKKKLLVDASQTFGDILLKLEKPKAKLFFDGEPLNNRQRICDNDEIEDEEQIDVKC